MNMENIVDTTTLDKFVGKNVEIHTANKRFSRLLEDVDDVHIIMFPTGKYDRIHYSAQIILSESIIAIREIIPESHLTEEEYKCKCEYDDCE